MGGNFPAGKREGRDGREGPPIFDTQGRPGGGTKDQPGTRRDAKIPVRY